ncbi:MAG: MBL fold metallo-hydrolase [Treponema sp.]|nr:MBL fold metallo-hydrolase [Treponema sp.]
MKIYFHLNLGGFSNCYVVANEKCKEAIIIDPGQITEKIIDNIESGSYKLSGVFITHNHGSHVHGLRTLRKIYTPKIYAADWEVAGNDTNVITGDGKVRIAGLTVRYMALPGHTADSMVYKIGNVLFTGDTISAGKIGTTNSSYSDFILRNNIDRKIFSQQDATVLMPGHGPPTCVGAEKLYNLDMVQITEKDEFSETPLSDE